MSVPDGTIRTMCGRYALTVDPESLYGEFDAKPDDKAGGLAGLYGGDPVRPRYNIAPTITVPVVRLDPRVAPAEAEREIEPMRWGLVPSWAKDVSVGAKMFNARVESLTTKGAFRRALEKRRCLVPATGYFEWRKLGGGAKPAKQPYYLTPADGSIMAFAGLWEYWRPAEGDPVVSMTIITSDAVGDVRGIHDRMPLILPASEWSAWLDPSVDPTPMLAAPSQELVAGLELRPVGSRVGNVRFDDASLVDRVDPPLALITEG
jgi:putative SOS response-associated peptidase YedK